MVIPFEVEPNCVLSPKLNTRFPCAGSDNMPTASINGIAGLMRPGVSRATRRSDGDRTIEDAGEYLLTKSVNTSRASREIGLSLLLAASRSVLRRSAMFVL